VKPPELISVCQMFLVPVSILFGALGVAPTEQLKTLISFMGALTSGLWVYRIFQWPHLEFIDEFTALGLAGTFLCAWLLSLVVHGRLWRTERQLPLERFWAR
jgi:hypothetical protein